jgi:hypothetical protein
MRKEIKMFFFYAEVNLRQYLRQFVCKTTNLITILTPGVLLRPA